MPMLVGGRKNVRVSRISKGSHIGGRSEGAVRKVLVTLQKGTKKRRLILAEKTFNPRDMLSAYAQSTQPNLRNPQGQYNTIRKIRQINQRFHLNLPLPTTVRLRRLKDGTKKLYVTFLKNWLDASITASEHHDLSEVKKFRTNPKSISGGRYGTLYSTLRLTNEEINTLYREERRISLVLEAFGFRITNNDAWIYTRDPKTKKIKVWLGDFGNVIELPQNERANFNAGNFLELEAYLDGKPYKKQPY
ncbi:MAG: hypothetical protein WCW13_01755 [archaeon]|jgi:hypothetical protein